MTAHAGGCLCGAVRYLASDVIDAGYCHCRACQRSSGAPVLAWASFLRKDFAYQDQGGEGPSTYASSVYGRRDFCPACGTQIAFWSNRDESRIDVNIPTFDEPGVIEPEYHTWVGSRIPWLHLTDDLPQYEDDGPDWSA